jgi:hypothetical protein
VCLIAAADTRAKRGLRELMAEFYDGYDRFHRLPGSRVGLQLHEDEGAVRLDPQLQLARPVAPAAEPPRLRHRLLGYSGMAL